MPKKKSTKPLQHQETAQPAKTAPLSDLDQLSPVAREQVENFSKALALVLRRITGRVPDERQMDLPKAVSATQNRKRTLV